MGFLTYDGEEVEIDDRTLTHLHIVIVQKLRRSESFAMSWALSSEVGSGRCSIWLHPSIPIHFKFSGSRVPTINPEWLAELTVSANSSRGLIVTPEISSDLRQPFARVEPGNHGNRLELIHT